MEEVNRTQLAELLGVNTRTINRHQEMLGYKNGKYDPVFANRAWIKYLLDQKDKEHDKTSEIKQYQLQQEREKAFKLQREREILEGAFLSKDDTRDTVLRLVHITKTKVLALKNVLQRKLKLNPAQVKIVNAELIKTLEDLSKGVEENGKEKNQRTGSKRSSKNGSAAK